MMNYFLNIENGEASLKETDHSMIVKRQYNVSESRIFTSEKCCKICGIQESIVTLYDGICKNCGKYYLYDEY